MKKRPSFLETDTNTKQEARETNFALSVTMLLMFSTWTAITVLCRCLTLLVAKGGKKTVATDVSLTISLKRHYDITNLLLSWTAKHYVIPSSPLCSRESNPPEVSTHVLSCKLLKQIQDTFSNLTTPAEGNVVS